MALTNKQAAEITVAGTTVTISSYASGAGVLVVWVAYEDTTTEHPSSIKFGTTSMSRAVGAWKPSDVYAGIYVLDIASSDTQDIVATFANDKDRARIVAAYDPDFTATVSKSATDYGAGTSAGCTLGLGTGGADGTLCLSCIGLTSTAALATTEGETEYEDSSYDSSARIGGAYLAGPDPAADQDMGWSWSGATNYAIAAAALEAGIVTEDGTATGAALTFGGTASAQTVTPLEVTATGVALTFAGTAEANALDPRTATGAALTFSGTAVASVLVNATASGVALTFAGTADAIAIFEVAPPFHAKAATDGPWLAQATTAGSWAARSTTPEPWKARSAT